MEQIINGLENWIIGIPISITAYGVPQVLIFKHPQK